MKYTYRISLELENPKKELENYIEALKTSVGRYNKACCTADNQKCIDIDFEDNTTVILSSERKLEHPTKALRLLSQNFLKCCNDDIVYHGKVFKMKLNQNEMDTQVNLNTLNIVSLNVNNFEGNKVCVPKKLISEDEIKILVNNLLIDNPDVIFLNEYPIAVAEDKGINNLFENYELHKYGDTGSITVALTKKGLDINEVEKSPNTLDGRTMLLELKNNDKSFILYGAHAPFGEERIKIFWSEMIEYTKYNNCILIGDLNCFNKANLQYSKYVKLLAHMTDMWLYRGGAHERITHDKGCRLDYVLTNKGNEIIFDSFEIDDTPRVMSLTDHSMLKIKIKL